MCVYVVFYYEIYYVGFFIFLYYVYFKEDYMRKRVILLLVCKQTFLCIYVELCYLFGCSYGYGVFRKYINIVSQLAFYFYKVFVFFVWFWVWEVDNVGVVFRLYRIFKIYSWFREIGGFRFVLQSFVGLQIKSKSIRIFQEFIRNVEFEDLFWIQCILMRFQVNCMYIEV